MIFKIVIKEEADSDVIEAYSWYESCQMDLGDEYIAELEDYLQIIEKDPHIYRIRKSNLRFCPLKRFPYLIVYEIEKKEIIVYAVFNTNQNPIKLDRRK